MVTRRPGLFDIMGSQRTHNGGDLMYAEYLFASAAAFAALFVAGYVVGASHPRLWRRVEAWLAGHAESSRPIPPGRAAVGEPGSVGVVSVGTPDPAPGGTCGGEGCGRSLDGRNEIDARGWYPEHCCFRCWLRSAYPGGTDGVTRHDLDCEIRLGTDIARAAAEGRSL